MMTPRYRGLTAAEIPVATLGTGVTAKVIAGVAGGLRGPVRDIVVDAAYLDVAAAGGAGCAHAVPAHHRCFAYVVEGEVSLCDSERVGAGHLVLFEGRGAVSAAASPRGCRYLLISGEPIGEPVAWYGPIVMNTEEELETAFREYREGTFISRVP
jgi:hypothetical protein